MPVKIIDNDIVIGELHLGKRPAVIAVDFSNGFSDKDSPLGGDFEPQLDANLELINAAIDKKVPVFPNTCGGACGFRKSSSSLCSGYGIGCAI